MRGLGNPALVKNKISLGKPTPKVPDKAPTQGTPNIKVSMDSDLRDKLNHDTIDLSQSQNKDGSYAVSIEIKNKSGKGSIRISDVKFFGYNVFLDSNAADKKGIDKKEAIDLLKDNDNLSYNHDSVKIGDKSWDIVMSSVNFKTVQKNGKDDNSDIDVNKANIMAHFKFTLPDEAGSSSHNFLYKITKLHFKYTFTPNDSSPQQTGSYDEKFTYPIVVMKLIDKITLPISKGYNGLYSTAFFSTKTKFQLDTFKFLDEEMSPYYFKAILGLLLNQGVSSFYYTINNFISTSRVKKDSLTTCYLINFGRTFNGDKLTHKLESKLVYAKDAKSSKELERVNKKITLKVNNLSFDVGEKGIPEMSEFKKSYVVQVQYENTKDYKYFYFYVEKQPLEVIALSANTAANSTLNGYFVKQGSLLSCTFPAQLVQQICTGEALSYSDSIAVTMMTGSIFGFYSPAIAMSSLSMLMITEFFIIYYVHYSGTIADSIWNGSNVSINDSFEDTMYASSFISKYSNAKNAYNAAVQISSAQGKTALLGSKDQVAVEGVFTTQTAFASEVINPNISYFARFNLKSAKDFFDTNTETYLTSEIQNWIDLMFADIFSINIAYATSILGPLEGMIFDGINVKGVNKKINFGIKAGDHLLNPFFNTAEHKLIADVPASYFYGGQNDKIIQYLDNFLKENKDSKNEILKYACKSLKRVVFYSTKRQLDLPFIARPFVRKGQDKQSTTIFKNSYCSPSMVFDNKKSILTKYETETMLPSNQKQAKINNAGQNGEIYKFTDDKLKFTPNTESFLNNTNIIGDGISLLW